jgi:hypothetical protein
MSRNCTECGGIIRPERLEILPDTQLCVSCQRMAETKPSPSPGYSGEFCPKCAAKGLKAELVWRRARDREIRGEFLGCSRYPECQYIDKAKKATIKQVNYLVQLGLDANEARQLTISQASDRISREKAGLRP